MGKKEYYEGMFGSLKHNIILMLGQLKANIKYAKRDTYDFKYISENLDFIENKIKEIREEIDA